MISNFFNVTFYSDCIVHFRHFLLITMKLILQNITIIMIVLSSDRDDNRNQMEGIMVEEEGTKTGTKDRARITEDSKEAINQNLKTTSRRSNKILETRRVSGLAFLMECAKKTT